jgi:GTP-binding protein YchF
MGLRCGIVGLPNVGKSTLFNALTSTAAAEAANYPFCTIEPNIGRVAVPDERLEKMAQIANSAKLIPAQIEFVDIAGLVRGASKGEGLGNQFLAHIREVDAIVQVVRCFVDENITHVEGEVDPLRDIKIIETELLLADLESVEKRIPNLEKRSRNDSSLKEELELLKEALALLTEGKPVRLLTAKYSNDQLARLQLLTSKPILYVCNLSENEVLTGNALSQKVAEFAQAEKARVVNISAQIEAEISTFEKEEDKQDFLASIGLEETGLSKIIRAGYEMLDLITFFTIGPKEAHAWTISKGTLAPQAAGVIHTDFEKGFIRAETISADDYLTLNGENGARLAGKLRLEGKDYLVSDGDVLHFRFNS